MTANIFIDTLNMELQFSEEEHRLTCSLK